MISSPPKLKAEADAKRQKNTEYIALLVCDQLFHKSRRLDIFRQIKMPSNVESSQYCCGALFRRRQDNC